MNQTFAAVVTLSLTMILWGLGRKPKNHLLKTTDTSFVEGVNQHPISLVITDHAKSKNKTASGSSGKDLSWQPPETSSQKLTLKRQLRKAMQGSPEMRLNAIQIATLWNNPSVLPFIKLGVKDSDSRVIIASAKALERYRGKTRKEKAQESRPPRNVALMR